MGIYALRDVEYKISSHSEFRSSLGLTTPSYCGKCHGLGSSPWRMVDLGCPDNGVSTFRYASPRMLFPLRADIPNTYQ